MVFSAKVFAGENMRSITVHNGLAGESVYKFYKSKWGVMWIGTSNGLSSYDGYHVQTYRVAEQRSKNLINDISQSNDGLIWVATKDGIWKLDRQKTILIRQLPEIKGNVSCIKIIGEKIYCGTDDGLYISTTLDGEKNVKHIWLSRNHVSNDNKVNDICIDGNALLILCNYEIYRYDLTTGKMHNYGLRSKLNINNSLRKIIKAGGRVFVGTLNDGLFVYNNKVKTLVPYVDVKCRVITCLSADSEKLYVGTDGGGLSVISLKDDRIVDTFSTDKESRFPLRDNTVYAYYHDSTGVDFFGYYRQGVNHNYYKNELFHLYKVPGIFDSGDKNIRSICIDGDVKVLGGRGGLWYIDEKKNTMKFFSPEELGGSIVTNIVKYAGQYYCCTFNGGVMRIDPKTLTTSRFGSSDALRNSSFGCLKVSPDNELWMSGNAGVYIYNAFTGEERHYDYRNSHLPDAYSNHIMFDRQNRCWISTAKGMCLYDPISKTIQGKGFPEGFFNSQSEMLGTWGAGDDLLFWSFDGLFRSNEEMTDFETINDETPSAKEKISQVIYDKRNRNYWVSTETGLFRYDSKLKGFQKFSDETGLMTSEFSNNAIAITDQNTLWTGTMKGLYYCNLDDAQHYYSGNAPIVLDNIMFDGDGVSGETIAEMLGKHILNLKYHWGAQTVSFTPVLMNYCDQSNLCFEYRFNKRGKWNYVNVQKMIKVENLPMGETIMEIRIAGNKKTTEYKFRVIPSGWFIMEIIGIIIFCLVLAILYRQRLIVNKQHEEMLRVQRELELTKRKYSRVNTDENAMQRLFLRLEDYMRTDKPFLDNGLKLSDVASYLGVSTVKLSQLFNMFIEKNYYDYINQWRLNEFKARLVDKRYAKYTHQALAEECGFKRSSFFTTFKKVEGVTPMEYYKRHKDQK